MLSRLGSQRETVSAMTEMFYPVYYNNETLLNVTIVVVIVFRSVCLNVEQDIVKSRDKL